MDATVISKDKKEQRIYIVLLIEVRLYGSSIFYVLPSHTHKRANAHTRTHAHTRAHTHAVTAAANRFATLSLLNADDA